MTTANTKLTSFVTIATPGLVNSGEANAGDIVISAIDVTLSPGNNDVTGYVGPFSPAGGKLAWLQNGYAAGNLVIVLLQKAGT